MELPSKKLEHLAFNTRPEKEEHLMIVMDKSFLEEHLSQPLQTNFKQIKIAITFRTGYNGTFNVTNSNNNSSFPKSLTDKDGFIQINSPAGAYEMDSLNKEIKKIIIDGCRFTETDHPFAVKLKIFNAWIYFRNFQTRAKT